MCRPLLIVFLALAVSGPSWATPLAPPSAAVRALEEAAAAVPTAARLRELHTLLASEPHVAGTGGDARVILALGSEMRRLGLKVEEHEIFPLLAVPVDAAVRVITGEAGSRTVLTLPIMETPVPSDPHGSHPDVAFGWAAYAASGDVTARVVYANRATHEDFATLRRLEVDVRGAVVVARYGGSDLGTKARLAEDAGAAALVLAMDPAESGWAKGLPWPEGGWANATSIQRCSVLHLPWAGDPLTPGTPAVRRARRLLEADVALPRIPVQPLGWGAAREILQRMTGPPAPEGWQGGLPFTYRVTGGDELRVQVLVSQERRIVRTASVVGSLRGSRYPDELVILGAHHDAWGHGAGDSTSSLIVVLEAARAFAEAARAGHVPARTVVFAAWGAEEFGLIGSTEWVEQQGEALARGAVAYLDLDGAAMGTRFEASSSAPLAAVLAAAAGGVPQPGGEAGETVLANWRSRGAEASDPESPGVGLLAGGRSHVAFASHAGIPSSSLGATGASGTASSTLHDTLAWYRATVGDDYASSLLLARVATRALARLAGDELVPYDLPRLGREVRAQAAQLAARARTKQLDVTFEVLDAATRLHEAQAGRTEQALRAAAARGPLDEVRVQAMNAEMLGLEREFTATAGLPGRPWWRSLLVGTSPHSGGAAWPLPALAEAIEAEDAAAARTAERQLVEAFRRAGARLARLEGLAEPPPSAATIRDRGGSARAADWISVRGTGLH